MRVYFRNPRSWEPLVICLRKGENRRLQSGGRCFIPPPGVFYELFRILRENKGFCRGSDRLVPLLSGSWRASVVGV